MKRASTTIWLVGGGTGGHAVPILEIYKRLKKEKPALMIRVIGAGTLLERQIYSIVGSDYLKIVSGKWHRHRAYKNIIEVFRFALGLIQSLLLVVREKPKLIFSKAGYVSLTVLFWARVFKIPYFIHESDIEMGYANQVAMGGAKKIFISYPPKYYKNLPLAGVIYSGPIVSPRSDSEPTSALRSFGFTVQRPIVFVTGGSQGALAINRAVAKIVPNLIKDYNIIHQTGALDYDWVKSFRETLPLDQQDNYYISDFLGEKDGCNLMRQAINASDLVISRAGSTILELAIMGKPMILIPYKYASANHQAKNAQFLEENGAAIVIPENHLSATSLLKEIEDLFAHQGRGLKMLSHNAKNVLSEDGLGVVCGEILREIGTR